MVGAGEQQAQTARPLVNHTCALGLYSRVEGGFACEELPLPQRGDVEDWLRLGPGLLLLLCCEPLPAGLRGTEIAWVPP